MRFGGGGVVRRASLAAGACALLTGLPAHAAAESSRPHVVFSIGPSGVAESSSLVASTTSPGLYYTADDSGDGPYVYTLNSSGRLVGTTTLAGVDPVDVEAMAPGSDGSLVVADIGDNGSDRQRIVAYRIDQPMAGDETVQPQKVELSYSDGPHNAESVLYDALTGRILVVTKQLLGRVYETPSAAFSRPSAVLRPVGSAPMYATDATFLPGHRAVVVRTYQQAFVYRYPTWRLVTSFDLPAQKQGESIALGGGTTVLVGSEGRHSRVWSVPLPAQAARLVAPPPSRTTTRGGNAPGLQPGRPDTAHGQASASRQPTSDDSTVVRVSTSSAVLVAVVGAAFMFHRRRTPKRPPPT